MSNAPASPLADLTEADVAAFLRNDVDFFVRHEALLAQLRLPHARGGTAVSLVERQVETLREQKREALSSSSLLTTPSAAPPFQ
jgi:uncharacterized protein YigA (DUF484 family)